MGAQSKSKTANIYTVSLMWSLDVVLPLLHNTFMSFIHTHIDARTERETETERQTQRYRERETETRTKKERNSEAMERPFGGERWKPLSQQLLSHKSPSAMPSGSSQC